MATAIKLDLLLQCYIRVQVISLLSSVKLLQRHIQIGHIRLMVFLMMQLHDLSRDDGLQSIIVIGQVG